MRVTVRDLGLALRVEAEGETADGRRWRAALTATERVVPTRPTRGGYVHDNVLHKFNNSSTWSTNA